MFESETMSRITDTAILTAGLAGSVLLHFAVIRAIGFSFSVAVLCMTCAAIPLLPIIGSGTTALGNRSRKSRAAQAFTVHYFNSSRKRRRN